MADELKPCKCGADPHIARWFPKLGVWVECADCGEKTRSFVTQTEAIEAWNRRAAPHLLDGPERPPELK